MQLKCVRQGDWMVYEVPNELLMAKGYKCSEHAFVEHLNATHRVIGGWTKIRITDDHRTLSQLVSINAVPRMDPGYLQRRRQRSRMKWAKYAVQGRRR